MQICLKQEAQHWRSKIAARTFSLTSFVFVVSVLLLMVSLAGCGSNESVNNAQLRVMNLALESGSLSVRVDDESSNWQSDIAYKTTTALKEMSDGSRRLRISNAGGVILDQTVSALSQQKQLLVVYGGASSLGMALLNNDIPSSSGNKTRVRLVNNAVGLGSYDLYITTASEDFRSVEAKATSTTSVTYELDAGTYTIRLTSPNTKDVLFELPARALGSQKYYNLVLYNTGSGELPSAFWIAQDDDAAPEFLASTVARVRAANALADSTAFINVSVDGTRIFTNVPFGGLSSYARTSSGAKAIAFTNTADPSKTYTLNDTFEGAIDYSTFLSADAGGAPDVFRIVDKLLPPSSGKVRVRLVNATSLADLSLALSFNSVTPVIASRAASNYIEVVGGDGTPVTITQGAAATPVISLAGVDLTAGRSYSIVVSGVTGTLQVSSRQDN
jgi:Domain of unknown function (DUF4397)